MNKGIKKLLVGVMASVMMLGSVTTAFAAGSDTGAGFPVAPSEPTTTEPEPATEPEKKEDVKVEAGEIEITVDTAADGTATVTEIAANTDQKVTVKKKIEIDGIEYKVTTIEDSLFKNCEAVEKVALPNSITTIGANAFSGAPESLKTIKLSSTGPVTVDADAFKGIEKQTKKMTIVICKKKNQAAKMSKQDLQKLAKSLHKAGYKGTIQYKGKLYKASAKGLK